MPLAVCIFLLTLVTLAAAAPHVRFATRGSCGLNGTWPRGFVWGAEGFDHQKYPDGEIVTAKEGKSVVAACLKGCQNFSYFAIWNATNCRCFNYAEGQVELQPVYAWAAFVSCPNYTVWYACGEGKPDGISLWCSAPVCNFDGTEPTNGTLVTINKEESEEIVELGLVYEGFAFSYNCDGGFQLNSPNLTYKCGLDGIFTPLPPATPTCDVVTTTVELTTSTTTLTTSTSTLTTSTSTLTTSTTTISSTTPPTAAPPDFFGSPPQPLDPVLLTQFLTKTDYRRNEWPGRHTTNATMVLVSVYAEKIGSVSEVTSSYEVEIFLFLMWADGRINYGQTGDTGPPGSFFQLSNVEDIKQIWQPPVFLSNAKSAVRPNVLQDNTQLLVMSDGQMVLQTRVQATADCPMELRKFPFDSQKCSLLLAVFGFFDSQVQLDWGTPDILRPPNASAVPPFSISPTVQLANFELVDTQFGEAKESQNFEAVCSEYHTCLRASFLVRRKLNFHLLNTYLPTSIIVVLSWLSFWVSPDNVPARMALAITTFLTLQAASASVRTGLPAVSYLKAVDVWLIVCQAVVFLTLCQFVIVHMVRLRFLRGLPMALRLKVGPPVPRVQSETDLMAPQGPERKIDAASRVLFPAAFILFAAIYFAYYTLII